MRDRKIKIAFLFLILGAFNLGFAPIFVKFVGLKGMGSNAIAFWRLAFGSLIFFSIIILRKKPLLLKPAYMLWALLAGFVFTLDLGIWHRSIMYAGAGLSTILGNTQVFNTAILSYFIFKEKPSLRFFIAAITAMIGVALLVGIGSKLDFTDKYSLGIILGLLTGLCYAFYLIILRHVGKKDPKPEIMTFIGWICAFATVFMFFGSLMESGNFMPPDLISWIHLFSLAALVQVFGWWAIFYSMSYIETSRVGLVLLLQPTMSTVWGYFFFKENLTPLQIIGGILTLICIYYGAKFRKAVQ